MQFLVHMSAWFRLRRCAGLGRTALAVLLITPPLYSQELGDGEGHQAMAPLIPFELTHNTTSLARYVMQYPSEYVQSLSTVAEFSELAAEFKARLNQDDKASPAAARARLKMALSLKYHMDKLGIVGIHTLPDQVQMSAVATSRLYRQVSRQIYTDSTLLQKHSANKALYQYYRMSAAPVDAQSMAGLAKVLKDKTAPLALKMRVYLQQLHYEALADETMMSLAKLRAVESKYYARVRGISVQARVFAELTLAAAYAGIKDGLKLRTQTYPQHVEFLKRAAGSLDRLPRPMARQVTKEVFMIWQLAADNRPQYLRLPVPLNQLVSTPYYGPVLERYALARYHHSLGGQPISSASGARDLLRPLESTYRKLLRVHSATEYQREILQRMLRRHQLIYQQTGDYVGYEQHLHWQLAELKRPALTIDTAQHLAQLRSEYDALVDQQIARTKATSDASRRVATIQLIDRYIKWIRLPVAAVVALYESQAKIYVMGGDYRRGVRTYLKAKNLVAEPPEKVRLMDLAIQYQGKLARWPRTYEWLQPPAQVQLVHLRPLRELYEQKLALVRQDQLALAVDPWHDVAHLGLILRYLGHSMRAAQLFADALVRFEDYSHGAVEPAAYLAMSIYESQKQWQRLEDLGMVLKQRQLRPQLGHKSLDVDDKIALALALGGRQLLRQQQYSKSVDKFARFLQFYAGHALAARVRFDYAQGLWGNTQYGEGLTQLEGILREYPQFEAYKAAVQLGLDWSMDLAHEKAILFFIQAYTSRYEDRRSFDLRIKAIELYHYQETFKDSYRNIQQVKASPFVTPAMVVAMDLKTLDLLEESGSQQDVITITSQLIRSSKDPRVLAQAYELQMNLALARRDKSGLKIIETALQKLGSPSPDIKEVMAMSRLHQLVMSQPQFLDHQVHNIALRDPLAYLRDILKVYTQLSKQYLELCTLSSSGCVAAVGYLQNITRRTRTHIDDVQINDDYDQKVQQEFLSFKSYMERVLEDTLARSTQVAHNVSRQRGGLPVMIQRMLWLEGKDWNFDPLTSGAGSGFVSWYVKDLDHVE